MKIMSIKLIFVVMYGKIICIENSNYWTLKAKKRLKSFENIEFKLEDILNLDEQNCYDLAIIHYVLHDIEKNKRVEMISKIKNSLKNKGIIYIREPTRKEHGISYQEIEEIMNLNHLIKKFSHENYSFPLKGKVYAGVFIKN